MLSKQFPTQTDHRHHYRRNGAHYCGHAGNGGKFFGGTLGVTTGHYDLRLRVKPMGAADVRAGFTIGLGGDTAGVHDDYVGLGKLHDEVSEGGEAVGHGLAVGTGRPAPEVFDMETACHLFQCTVDADYGGRFGG